MIFMPNPAIIVDGISKKYRIGLKDGPRQTFREAATGLLTAPVRRLRRLGTEADEEGEFYALKDVSFQVQPGEVVGIIGRNGAGKSTLLKILSRITEPTSGEIRLRGRVASLLEVGTGFHPELTGRENIYLNGAILGMKREEIRRKFDEIVAFAETEKFLDTAVKYYSSGMYVRLAFAVAAHLEPEILIVDEVLAVGDAEFQKKCLGKMREVARGEGRTVLFVSHQMAAVKALCHRCVLVSDGHCDPISDTVSAVGRYLGEKNVAASGKQMVDCVGYVDHRLTVRDIACNGHRGSVIQLTGDEDYLTLEVTGVLAARMGLDLEIWLRDVLGTAVAYASRGHQTGELELELGQFTLKRRIRIPRINHGILLLDMMIWANDRSCLLKLVDSVRLSVTGCSLLSGKSMSAADRGVFFLESDL
jgi:lipopolysaccharide transport system ATP-binding protein